MGLKKLSHTLLYTTGVITPKHKIRKQESVFYDKLVKYDNRHILNTTNSIGTKCEMQLPVLNKLFGCTNNKVRKSI